MARSYDGRIPSVPIDADTSKADKKIDALFDKIDTLQHIEIDANISNVQRKLETLVKRTNAQLSSGLMDNMIKDFRVVLGAMRTEYEKNGITDIYKSLEKTCDMVQSRFENLTVSVGKKQFSGLEQILSNITELESVTSFRFGEIVSKQDVSNSDSVVKNIKETKKEIKSIVDKIDYISKTLDKDVDSALSEQKLKNYKKRVTDLQEILQSFSEIDNPLIKGTVSEATIKAANVLNQISQKQAVATKKQAEAQHSLSQSYASTTKSLEKRLKLSRRVDEGGPKNPEGQYVTDDGLFEIDRDVEGWKVHRKNAKGLFEYVGVYKTLNDIRADGTLIAEQEAKAQERSTKAKNDGVKAIKSAAKAQEDFNKSKNDAWDKQDSLTAEYDQVSSELDALKEKYTTVLGLVQDWQNLNERIGKISGQNSKDLRKNLLSELSSIPSELALIIGDEFAAGLANGFKGIKTKDIVSMVSSIANRDLLGGVSELLDVLEDIDFDNIDISAIESLKGKYDFTDKAIDFLDQICEKRQKQLEITQKLSDAQWELFDAMGRETDHANSLLTPDDLARIEAERRAFLELGNERAGRREEEVRSLEQVNAELDIEKKKLEEIEKQQNRNEAARAALQKKRENYSKELGSDKPVYDTDKLKSAANSLREFNTELDKRNQFIERYNQLCEIIEQSYVGPYSISNGLNRSLEDFINGNPDMQELSQFVINGIKGVPTKHINELFRSVVNSLKNEGREIGQLISSGDVLGAPVTAQLEEEEIRLGQEQQRLHDEYQAQLTKINDLKNESLELTIQIGQAEKKNDQQLSSAVDTTRSIESQVKSIEDAYDAASENVNRLETELQKAINVHKTLQKHAEVYGYTLDMDVKKAGRVQGILEKTGPDFSKSRSFSIPNLLKQGHSVGDYVDGSATMRGPRGTIVSNLTKTEYEYAQYLLAKIKELNVGWEQGLEILRSQNGELDKADEYVKLLSKQLEQAQEVKEAAYERMSYAHAGIIGDEAIAAKKRELEESNRREAERAQAQMQKTAELIGSLHEKYGDKFGQIFGSLDALSTENAESMYDMLIAKEQEYFDEIKKRGEALSNFAKIANEQYQDYSGIDAFRQKYGVLAQDILDGKIGIEQASSTLKEFADALTLDSPDSQTKVLITSYQELYNVLQRVVDLSKQLKPEWTDEFSSMQTIMDKASYPGSKENLLAEIKAQYDNVKRIKTSIKNGLSVYKYADGSGYEAEYDIGRNTLKDAEETLRAYIYQAVEYFGYTVADVMNDFDKKRVRAFVEDRINEYLDVSSKNDKYQIDAESFNAPIKEAIESIATAITSMVVDSAQSDKVSDLLYQMQHQPHDVNRYTLSSQSNYIGSLIGIRTPYDEIEANAKKIESYKELCEVVSEYNELQRDATIFGGTEYPGLSEADEIKREELRKRLQVTGGKEIFKLSGFNGFDDVDKLAKALDIEIPQAIDNVVKKEQELLDTAGQVTEEIKKQGDSAEDAAAGIKDQEDAEEDLQDEIESGDDEKIRIIQKTVDDALAQLRNAKDNKNLMIDLSEVSSPDDLRSQIGNLVQTALGEDLSVGDVTIADNIAKIGLYNKELGITTQQTWQLKQATEEAAEAQLEFVKADPLRVDFKKAQKYAKDQQKLLDDSTKWINSQLGKLDTQERSYKYSGKKIDGKTLIENFDGTVPDQYIGKTIDNLANNIRQRLTQAIGSSITDEFKNSILNDLRILENEVKVQQYKTYASTTMTPTEIGEARKQFEYMLDSLEAKAKKNNVFSQMEESLNSLRDKVTKPDVEGYIKDGAGVSGFVDSLRTARAELNAAISDEGVVKKEQQNLQNALNLQERLYKAKKNYETLKIKGELDTSDGLEAKRKVEDLEAQYQVAEKLLRNEESRTSLAQQRGKLDEELNKVIEEQTKLRDDEQRANADAENKQNIKSQYESILDTINKINAIDSNILSYQGKDGGTGIFAGYIEQLQSEKSRLVSQLHGIAQEINSAFSDGIIQGKEYTLPTPKFLQDDGAISNFLNDTRTQAVLTSAEIDNLVASLQKSQNIDVDAATKVVEQFKSVQEIYKQINSLTTLNKEGSLYKGAENIFVQIMRYKDMLSSDSTMWTPEQSANLQSLINLFNEYGNALVQAGQKEESYFRGKTKYTTDLTTSDVAKENADEIKRINDLQKQLEKAATSFAKDSGLGDAFITGFEQSADGITKLDFSVFDAATNSLRNFRMEMGSVTDGMYITETTVDKSLANVQNAQKQLKSIGTLIDRLGSSNIDMNSEQIQRLVQAYSQLSAELNKGDGADQSEITRLAKDSKLAVAEVEKLYNKHIQLQNAIETGNAEGKNIDMNGDIYKQMTAAVNEYANAHDGANVKMGKFNAAAGQLKFTMESADGTLQEFTVSLDKLGSQCAIQQTGITQLKSKWDQFKDGLSGTAKQFMTAFVGMNAFYEVIAQVRKGYQYVKEIDLAMTELKKVTNETDLAYDSFLDTASKRASVIGSTVSDFTEATANFARLGYTMDESAKMAETAIVYKNVADGLDTVEESTDSIISTMKAFGIESDNTMSIIDKYNEVGNNFAITSAGIGDALQRSASALFEAGNTIDESIALVTAANSVIQNPEQVGTALKTLALRLRGAKVELEEASLDTENMAESTSQLQAKLKALTHGQVDIMLDEDTFKSTTQILREMSEAWEDMTDIERASALELMGGKRQANILASVIKNFDTVDSVIETSMNSQGSAMAENEKYLDSIQGKTDLLTNSMQTLWSNALNSDFIKGLLDIANAFVKAADGAGLLNTAIGAFLGYKTLTSKDGSLFDIFKAFKFDDDGFGLNKGSAIGQIISGAATGGISGAAGAFKSLGAGAKIAAAGTALLNSALSMGISLLVGFAITKGIEAIDNWIHRAEILKEEVEGLKDTYKSAKKTFDSNLDKLTTSSDPDLYETLQDEFNRLSQGVDRYGNNISLTTDQYERYKQICEQIVDINPSLAAGYDTAAEAIGNNVDVLSELIELQKYQSRQNVDTIISDENFDKVAKDAINDYRNAATDYSIAIANSGDALYGTLHKVFREQNQSLIDTNFDADADGTNKDDFIRYVLDTLGKEDATKIAEEYYSQALGDYDVNSFLFDYFDEISNNTSKFGAEYQDVIGSVFYDIGRAVKSAEDNLKQGQDGAIDEYLLAPQGMEAGEYYDQLNDASKNFINDWIKNSNQFKIDEHTTEQTIKDNRDKIIEMVKSLADEDFTTMFDGEQITGQDLLDQIYNFDPSTVNWTDYQSKIGDYVDAIWNLIGGESNKYGIKNQQELMISLGFNFVEDNQEIAKDRDLIAKRLGITVDEMNDFLAGMTAAEIQAFYKIDWNEVDPKNSDTRKEIMDNIHKKMASISEVASSKTYSVLLTSVESYNEALKQTSEIVSDNTEVTQEYKDAIIDLGVSEDELNKYFYDDNKLIVKNARGLNNLVKSAKQSTAQNIKLAKSQARLDYYELYKEMRTLTKGTQVTDAATLNYINSLYEQMNVLQRTIAKYSLLEAELLGAANAYQELADAQAADEAMDYGTKAEEMVNVLANAFNTGELGTEAARVAIEGLIPDSIFEDADTLDDKMQKIYDYFTDGEVSKLFTIEFDEEGVISSIEMTRENVQAFAESLMGDDADSVFQGTWDEFTLNPAIKTLEDFAEQCGVTEEIAFAFLTELEKYDIGNALGDGESLLDQLMGDNLDYQLQKAMQTAAEVEKKLAEGKISASDQEYVDAQTNLEEQEEKALTDTSEWLRKQQALQEQEDTLKDLQKQYKEAYEAGEDTSAIEDSIINTSGVIDDLVEDLREIDAPTEFVLKVAKSEAEENIAEFKDELQELVDSGDEKSIKINAFVEKVDTVGLENLESLGFVKGSDGVWRGSANIEGWTSLDPASKQKVLEYINMIEGEHQVDVALGGETPTVEQHLQTISETLSQIANLLNPSYTLEVITSGAQEKLDTFKSAWDTLTSKEITLTQKIKTIGDMIFGGGDSESGPVGVNGTAHASGTANAGGSWGAPKTETSLVGELGPEILVRGNRWTTVGDNGAEFTQVKKGDIIFNHKQTEQLLKNGYVTGRGKAYAHGTAFASIDTWMDGVDNLHNDYSNSSSTAKDLGAAADSLNNAADNVSDASDEFEEVFDWIEVRLEEINEKISLRSAQLENAVGSSEQNAIIDNMIRLNQSLYDNLIAGANEYYNYAKALLSKVPEKYREAAQDGTIAIEKFVGEVDEKTLEAIQDYREWVQKGADATQQAEETLTEIANLAEQAIQNIEDTYDNVLSLNDSKVDRLDASNAYMETTTGFESEEIYRAMMQENDKKIKTATDKLAAMEAELDKRVQAGEIEVESQAWYDAVNAIAEVDTEIINLKTDNEDLQDSINELHWEKFDLLMKQFEAVADEAENLLDILGTKDAVDELGNWTDEGITSLGLLAQQMEVAEMQAQQYKEEIEYLNKNWESLGYTQEEYIDKLEELKSGQYDAIQSYHDTKEAIVDLNEARIDAIKDGIEKEIEAYEELIDKKKEELDAEKDLYDFQKNVNKQQKEISNIERKLAALSSDNSASARAQRAKLEAELYEARAELEETYYDRSISDQQDALDKELESFKKEKDEEIEGWEKYLENVELVVADSLAMVQENTKTVLDTLTAMGEEFGLTITEALINPWKAGETAIQNYGAKLNVSLIQLASMFGMTVDQFASQLGMTTAELVSKLDITVAQMAENLGLTNEQLAERLGLTVGNLSGMMDLTIQDLAANMGVTLPVLAEMLGTTTAGLAGNLEMTMTQFAGKMGLTTSELASKFGLTASQLADKLGMSYQDLVSPFGLSMSATVDALKALETEYASILANIEAESKRVVAEVNKAMESYQSSTTSQSNKADTSQKKAVSIGSKINAGNAKIYKDSYGGSPGTQYYAKDPVYTIIGEKNGYWLVRYHKLSSGYTGWFKKSDVKAYAKGTKAIEKDQWALIDELGDELQLIPDGNGRLSYMKKGTGVVPADLTANLMEWGKLNPSTMLEQNRPQIGVSPSAINNTTEISIDASVGELLHVEHLDGNNPAEVTKLIDKAWDKRMKELNGFIRKYNR